MHKLRPEIALRFLPFSHTPGTPLVLPGSYLKLRAYPAKLQVFDLERDVLRGEIQWALTEAVEEFTVSLDMEKGQVLIWMRTGQGFFRYRLQSLQGGECFGLTAERAPQEGVAYSLVGTWRQREPDKALLREKDQIWVGPRNGEPPLPPYVHQPLPRLSLGCHKKQDWDLVRRRADAKEILPFWLRLGGLMPSFRGAKGSGGTLALLERLKEEIQSGSREELSASFMRLFKAGFDGILSPQLEDGKALGQSLPPLTGEPSPVTLLTEGARLILSLFVSAKKEGIRLIPHLPSEFHSGRLVQASVGDLGELDLEWRKKDPRRLALRAHRDGEVRLLLPAHIRGFRLRKSAKDRGVALNRDDPLHLIRDTEYFLDGFQK